VIVPSLEWVLPDPVPDPPSFAGFGRPVSTLLARRGFRDDDQLAAFLGAGAGALHDLSRMADADRALDRIDAAIANGEGIAIWGDYDADGMTAIVVWVTALRRLGADPLRYVPSRLEEGYGLSATGLRRLRDLGATVVQVYSNMDNEGSEGLYPAVGFRRRRSRRRFERRADRDVRSEA